MTGMMTYHNNIGQPSTTAIASGTTNGVVAGTNIQNLAPRPIDLLYSGRKLQMDLQSNVMMFNMYAFSSLKITNAHGLLTNHHTWLYVDGNIEDAFLVDIETRKDTILGEGLHNRWLNIGTMAGGEIRNYFLIYSYMGKDECENDTVIVYSAFDASDVGYFPSDIENYGIEQVSKCNRGEKKKTILDLLSARIKIAGRIDPQLPNPRLPGTLHFMEGYAMDYVINGKVSQGALNDPSITFRIPAGQVYVDTTTMFGIASFEYPVGSGFQPIPQEIRDAMKLQIGMLSDPTIVREFTIHVKDLLEKEIFMMPGWGYTPMNFTDADRVFTIRIPLVPLCETELTGLRFRSTFNGTTFCYKPCEEDGTFYITPSIFPDVVPEYRFNVTMNNISDSRVYSNEQTKDTLLVTFKKDLDGLGKEIDITNYVI